MSTATQLAILLSIICWPLSAAGMTLLWGLSFAIARPAGDAQASAGRPGHAHVTTRMPLEST